MVFFTHRYRWGAIFLKHASDKQWSIKCAWERQELWVRQMPPQMNCPACGSNMRSRSLFSHYSLKPYRVCPDCNARYTTDLNTRKRQIPIALLGLNALGLTFAASLKGVVWLLPAVVSQIILWVYVGYALSEVIYVKYSDWFFKITAEQLTTVSLVWTSIV